MEFVAVVLSSGALPVVVVECDISIPTRGWEIRASGLWADHVCEKPLAHWSYGLEAFALAVESGTELEPDGRGERVPLGWELEFEADGDPEWSTGEESWHGYVQFGQVHGLLLDADGETEFTGAGTRGHWWGEERPATAGTRRQASTSGESVSARGGQDRVAVRYQHQLARAETTLCDGVLLTVWTPDEALENRPDSLG